MHGLKLADIQIDRKMLSELAVNDKAAFAQLIELAKGKLALTKSDLIPYETNRRKSFRLRPAFFCPLPTEKLTKSQKRGAEYSAFLIFWTLSQERWGEIRVRGY